MNTNQKTRMLTEGAVCVALAVALSFFKIPIGVSFGGFGGSIDLVMIPLIVFAYRWGLGWGLIAGLAFGMLKYFIGNGWAVSWVSIIFDYSVAYMMVGLAGLFKGKKETALPVAALVGCIGRFIIHYISGVTVYAQWMPEEFMNMKMTSPAVYSLLYNGTYMLPNTILAVVLCIALIPLMKRLPSVKQ